ncbi:MAG: potassium channel family protein [Ignavibacteria bacterium]|nr:potassium channel family protein [Ignavibacteria bacterium]
MIKLLLQIRQVWKEDEEFRVLARIMIVLLAAGIIYYSLAENWSIVDSIYFCIMTISTVGYGDLLPTSDFSKIFTVIYSVLGIGVFVGIVTKIAQSFTKKELEKHKSKKSKNNKGQIN